MTMHNAQPPAGMAQCSVTGKFVPEDELVTIQGQRVCAEGKAILLDRLRSGEAMPGELEKPTVLRRFGAIFLDGLIFTIPFAILGAILGASGNLAILESGVLTLASTAASVLYLGALHARDGQTLGKKAAKLRVVNNSDGSAITTGTAFSRALLYAGPSFVSGFMEMTRNEGAILIAAALVGVWGIANVLFALFDRDRQRALHDRIVGTRVIHVQ